MDNTNLGNTEFLKIEFRHLHFIKWFAHTESGLHQVTIDHHVRTYTSTTTFDPNAPPSRAYPFYGMGSGTYLTTSIVPAVQLSFIISEIYFRLIIRISEFESRLVQLKTWKMDSSIYGKISNKVDEGLNLLGDMLTS